MVTIEIDGQKLEAEAGSMIIAAADKAGIHIPRFCYHKKLSIAANCRMCLVDVHKAPKPMPACATPVTEGMVVFTQTPRAKEAQQAVMEFLLINHPLDCPICDQGGECELQDTAMSYGQDFSRFNLGKRAVKDHDLGPLIATDMTRCIHCTRCVRFGTEIAGQREMGATGRGEHMEIGPYLEKNIDSELSGNIIDLCPVGALTSKPFRFSARAWELKQHKGIASHDCLGSHVFWHTHHQSLKRVVPRENSALNETWLSDRDRFGYLGLSHEDRLTQPMVKCGQSWEVVSWEAALATACHSLKQVVEMDGPEKLAALIHPSATTEEAYLLQQLMRGLGSNNIDHRLRLLDPSQPETLPLAPSLGCSLEEIEACDVLVLVGSNVRQELPILSQRIRKAVQRGARVFLVNSAQFEQIFEAQTFLHPAGELVQGLGQLLKAVGARTGTVHSLVKDLKPDPTQIAAASVIAEAKSLRVLLGPMALSHPHYMQLRFLAQTLAAQNRGTYGELSEGANSAGCWLAGAVPHRGPQGHGVGAPGLAACDLIQRDIKAMLLVHVDPALDLAYGAALCAKLQKAQSVIAITAFKTPALADCARVLLPAALVPETSGTFVNACGSWQSFNGVVAPPGQARPVWKILRVLANLLKLELNYQSPEEVLAALKAVPLLDHTPVAAAPLQLSPVIKGLVQLSPTSMYALDGSLRRATALQETTQAKGHKIARINPRTATLLAVDQATKIQLSHQAEVGEYALALDPTLAEDTLLVEAGTALVPGAPYASVQVRELS